MQPGTRVEWAGIVEAREDDDPRDTETLVKTLIDLKQKCIIIEREVREWEGKLKMEKEGAVKAGIAAKKRQADSAKLIRGAFAGMRGPTPRAPLGARSNRPADDDDFDGEGMASKRGGDRSGEDVLKLLLSTDHVAIGRWPRSTLLADVLVLTRHHTALQERLKSVKVENLKTHRVKATNTVKATAPQGRGGGKQTEAGRLAEDAMLSIDSGYKTASLLAAALRDERAKPPLEKVVYRDAPQTEAVAVSRTSSQEQRAASQRQEGAIAQYEVMIRTGSCRSAGTMAAVWISLTGSLRDIGTVVLEHNPSIGVHQVSPQPSQRHPFSSRGGESRFTVDSMSGDIGHITSVGIGHNGKESKDAWFIAEVCVRRSTVPTWSVCVCNNWLKASPTQGSDAHAILSPSEGLQPTLARPGEFMYRFVVKTGEGRGMGTTARVSVDVIGQDGRLADRVLECNEADFVRASEGSFEVEGHDIGALTGLRIRHDDSGFSPNWFLKWMRVELLVDGEKDAVSQWFFPCNRWLSSNKTVSAGGVECLLYPSASHAGEEDKFEDDPRGSTPEFVCKLSGEFMVDPVVAADGHTYERRAIEEWLASGQMSSPTTKRPMTDSRVTPNLSLKALIARF